MPDISDPYTEMLLADICRELFGELSWHLKEFRWGERAGEGAVGTLHYLAFEAVGENANPVTDVRKPWFMVCVSEISLSGADLSERLFASWNMDFPVLVTLDRTSLSVFDCTGRSDQGRSTPDISLDLRFSEEFREKLYSTFSLQEPERTGFWRYIARRYDLRDTGEMEGVDKCLLRTLESWREVLARRINLAHPLMDPDELNLYVMKVLLRLLWEQTVRETRAGVDPGNGNPGSGIFPPAKPAFPFLTDRCPALDEDELIRELDEKGLLDNKFFFSWIPFPRIVSAFHELLKTRIRLDQGLQSRIGRNQMEEIALPLDSTVDLCIGEVARWQDGRPDESPAILDPVCGCGLFLSRLPAILLAKSMGRQSGANDPVKRLSGLVEIIVPCRPDFTFFHDTRVLSEEEAVQIAGELYGVEPDPLAAEVCRLILALVLQELAEEDVGNEIIPRIADILRANVICGDILIGDDFRRVVEWRFPGQTTQHEATKFEISGFLHRLMNRGGFTAVTGFFGISGKRMRRIHRHYLQTRYAVFHRDSAPLSCLVERAFELLRPGGTCCVVLPGGWLRLNVFRAMRAMLAGNRIHSISDVSYLFLPPERDSHYSILMASPAPPGGEVKIARGRAPPYGSLSHAMSSNTFSIPQDALGPGGWSLVDRRLSEMQKKIETGRPSLDEYVMGCIFPGTVSVDEYPALLSRTQVSVLQTDHPGQAILLQPYISGEQVSRYGVLKADRFLLQDSAFSHNGQENSLPMTPENGPKLIIGTGHDSILCTFDQGGFLAGPPVLLVPGDDLYLLGVLNSKISSFYIRRSLSRHPAIGISSVIRRIPIHVVDLGDRDEAFAYNRIVSAVKRMLSLNEDLNHYPEHEEEIRALIKKTDLEIERLCFQLYGLSDEDTRTILSSSG